MSQFSVPRNSRTILDVLPLLRSAELYQVGNTIWGQYESEEWKHDEKIALMAALRKAGQIRGPKKPVYCLSPLKQWRLVNLRSAEHL